MVDRRFRDSAWGQPAMPLPAATAKPAPSEWGEVPAAPEIESSGPEIAPSGPSAAAPTPATISQDDWGRPLAPVGTSSPTVGRNSRGQFQTGSNGGPGRKKGSRNRLTNAVLTTFAADFEEYGPEVLAKLREKDPAAYMQLAVNLIPRHLIAQQENLPDFEDWEEVNEFIEQAKRKRMVEIALEELNKQ